MILKNKKEKEKTCRSVCDPAREVKREWNSCTAQKEKENGVPALSEKREK
jgi:hypothetical protein